MKRDMDLARVILMAVEESDEQVIDAAQLASDTWDEVTVARHLELMRRGACLLSRDAGRGPDVPSRRLSCCGSGRRAGHSRLALRMVDVVRGVPDGKPRQYAACW